MLMVNHRSLLVALFVAVARLCAADTSPVANVPDWLAKPLSLSDCLDLALKQNSAILKGNSDLEAAHGVVLQTRAISIPRLRAIVMSQASSLPRAASNERAFVHAARNVSCRTS